MKKEDRKVPVELGNKVKERARSMNLQQAITCLEMAIRWQNGFTKVYRTAVRIKIEIFCHVRM